MLLTLSRPREAHFRHSPVVGAMGLTKADGGRTDRRVLDVVRPMDATPGTPSADIVDEWGMQSFPASDPPANW
jgi:hypothetical protein